MKVWITSDTHFNHTNIIKYCNRPFPSIYTMNEELIKRWNSVVDPSDIVLFLGDFCFAKPSEAEQTTLWLTGALKGHKFIIKGNHDFQKLTYTKLGWEFECFQEFVFNSRFSFRHRPDNIQNDAQKFDFIFYGHVHDKIVGDAPYNTINVCCDVHDFTPMDITNYFTEKELLCLKSMVW